MKPRPFREMCHECGTMYQSDLLNVDPNDHDRLLCDFCLDKQASEGAPMNEKLKTWRTSQPPPKRRHRAGVKKPYLSQSEAARYFKVSISTYRAWERGQRAPPDYVTSEVTK